MSEHTLTDGREVVEETINAYRVQRLSDGSVRIKSPGRVVTSSTYFEALERYAQGEQRHIDGLPPHLRSDHRESIRDGFIPLRGQDSSAFSPIEILEEVTGEPRAAIRRELSRLREENGP